MSKNPGYFADGVLREDNSMAAMHRNTIRASVVFCLGLLLCSLGVLLGAQRSVRAQDSAPTSAEYVGAGQCSACHKDLARFHGSSAHALALQNADDKSILKADFTAGEKERTLTFPGDSTARPLVQDDIAFVVGSGGYVERYLYYGQRTSIRRKACPSCTINGVNVLIL
jgi:hypothetical protein